MNKAEIKEAQLRMIDEQIAALYKAREAVYGDPLTLAELDECVRNGEKVWVRYVDYGDEGGHLAQPRIDEPSSVTKNGACYEFFDACCESDFDNAETNVNEEKIAFVYLEYDEGEFAVFRI
ncbi:MAG: hypothetical protein R3309_01715 [Reinekea sp.]|nr:hypothetical protein [Reinekea sp.]